jgi:hypothetical protein
LTTGGAKVTPVVSALLPGIQRVVGIIPPAPQNIAVPAGFPVRQQGVYNPVFAHQAAPPAAPPAPQNGGYPRFPVLNRLVNYVAPQPVPRQPAPAPVIPLQIPAPPPARGALIRTFNANRDFYQLHQLPVPRRKRSRDNN